MKGKKQACPDCKTHTEFAIWKRGNLYAFYDFICIHCGKSWTKDELIDIEEE